MRKNNQFTELFMIFIVVTACITIGEGIIGVIFLPNATISYWAFFSPPIFGILSTILGLVTYSKKEMSVRQAIIRKVIHLILIEMLVFIVNIVAGADKMFSMSLRVALGIAIALIYVSANLILWMNDRRSAIEFNEQLKRFQNQE